LGGGQGGLTFRKRAALAKKSQKYNVDSEDDEEQLRPGTRILLVEDDSSIADFVEPELERLGFHVRCAYDGLSGLEEARRFRPELVILDIMLPKLDGVGVLKGLRREGSWVPIVMLTARDAKMDKVHSLNLGADDYVTKPFDIEELVARIQALLRRVEGEEILRVADLEVNSATREVRRGERQIDLTAREYELLEFMARNHRRVLSRELLLSRVWDQNFGITTNAVEVYIGYLRKKVDAPGEQKLIKTLRGAGYALREG
jgi:DNA-binding response OmpR family regulator